MTELYFNPFAIETVQNKWNQVHSSKLGKAKDIVDALRYDLLVRNPYKMIFDNTNNVIFNKSEGKIKKIAASAIVMLAYTYTTIMYGFLAYSFGASINTIAIFSKSEKIAHIAYLMKEVGNKMLMLATAPTKSLFYKIPKELVEKAPLFLKVTAHKVCKVRAITFDNILVPFFKVVKKVMLWNYLQLVLAVRVVFDKTSEVCDWTFQNFAVPFWKKHIDPRINSFKKTMKACNINF